MKTLKEITLPALQSIEIRKLLKHEAIKWYHRSDDDKHKFIKEFFNLTDEEIKKHSTNTEEKE